MRSEAWTWKPLVFYPVLLLFYLFFADSSYRVYYFYEWGRPYAHATADYVLLLAGALAAGWGLYLAGAAAGLKFFRLEAAEAGWEFPRGRSAWQAAAGALAGAGAYFLNTGPVTVLLCLLQEGRLDLSFLHRYSFSASAVSFPLGRLTALSDVVAAPLLEELVFRGLIFALLRRRLGDARAALLTSALFSLTHLTINKVFLSGHDGYWVFNQFVYHFIGGLVYNLLFMRARSLAAPAGAHMAYNLLSTFLVRA
jgi:membrane protease YdiL (CAAX protease family)